ncbi:thioesterase II family protein [Streptomyces sp. WMMC905]|uniref:thioesterase II family protein n=1 Tax=Streptomyces sp. WMMC905 TaxID=3404123 RepID=UPI003B94657F
MTPPEAPAREPGGAAARGAAAHRWLAGRRDDTGAVADVYVFAHAGGSVGEYLRWAGDLAGLRVRGVQLPGRSARLAEPAYDRLAPLVEDLVAQVSFAGPCVFLGHSFGALVAYETARALHRDGRPGPGRLVLSSLPPPHLLGAGAAGPKRPLAALPDGELVDAVEQRWGPLAEQVRRDPGLRRLVLDPLRSDLRVLESYTHRPGPRLPTPATLVCGSEEREDLRMDGWSDHLEQVTGPLPGGHFHFRTDRAPLLATVREAARTLTTSRHRGDVI